MRPLKETAAEGETVKGTATDRETVKRRLLLEETQ
jgi:hypothetical protein